MLNYRPFYIIGEVNNPGSYQYVNGMTVINAVALAGGFTYRADQDDIMITRGGSEGRKIDDVRVDTPGPARRHRRGDGALLLRAGSLDEGSVRSDGRAGLAPGCTVDHGAGDAGWPGAFARCCGAATATERARLSAAPAAKAISQRRRSPSSSSGACWSCWRSGSRQACPTC